MKENKVLDLKDYSVSQENFSIVRNGDLDLLITVPQPNSIELWKYYQTDDYISHTSSKKTIIDKIYHAVREIAIRNKVDLVNSKQRRGSVLDIGTGTGDFLLALKEDLWETIGVEPSNIARNLASQKGLNIRENTSQLPSNSYDVITMWHVLEHVPNYDEQIIELKRLLKKSGTLIVAVPNYKSYDAQYYQKHWAAYDVPRHFWHFSQTSIRVIFGKHGFKLKDVRPMKFDSYYVSLLSEKYKTGRTNYLKAFWIGFKSNWKARKTSEFSSLIYILELK